MSADKEKAILNVTQDMVRQGGYNGFSFRNIAAAVGIKSSSVHYHFATKEDLAAAVARNYTDDFLLSLGEPVALKQQGKNPVGVYIEAFRGAVAEDKGMCLCGMLAAESDVIPESVAHETREFFRRNIEWLESAFIENGIKNDPHKHAVSTLCILEGAMIACNIMGEISLFDIAASAIVID